MVNILWCFHRIAFRQVDNSDSSNEPQGKHQISSCEQGWLVASSLFLRSLTKARSLLKSSPLFRNILAKFHNYILMLNIDRATVPSTGHRGQGQNLGTGGTILSLLLNSSLINGPSSGVCRTLFWARALIESSRLLSWSFCWMWARCSRRSTPDVLFKPSSRGIKKILCLRF